MSRILFRCDCPGARNRPRNGWLFLGGFLRAQVPQPAARSYAETSSDNSKPSRPLHACVSPNQFSIPSSLLHPLTDLRLILLLPIARSAALFVHGTFPRRRRHNSARHFPTSSTQSRWLAERGDRPSAHASAAHPRIRWGLSAAVDSLRAMPEGAPAVGTWDEPYSFHGREILVGLVCCTQLYQDFPPYFSPTVSGTVTGAREIRGNSCMDNYRAAPDFCPVIPAKAESTATGSRTILPPPPS